MGGGAADAVKGGSWGGDEEVVECDGEVDVTDGIVGVW